jgi:hypothetical protein
MSFIQIGDKKINKQNICMFECSSDKCTLTLNKTPDSLCGKYSVRSSSTDTYEYKSNHKDFVNVRKAWCSL